MGTHGNHKMETSGEMPILHSPSIVSKRQRGSAMLEMAMTLSVLLFLLLGTLDLGRAIYAQNIIANAAREGARYGTIAPTDTQGIQQQTEQSIVGLDPNAVTITIDTTPTTVQVTVTYQFTAITPLIGKFLGQGGTVILKGVSTMNIEGSQ
ncbi:MAG: pilus assembly protein [Chloroflexi bacterium]|nr:MAG: pilus assembly protein [Chloroflexota bacterium]